MVLLAVIPRSKWQTKYYEPTRWPRESHQRLRVIGVTWNDEASAQAALLLESLTDAGFDNVVPVRLLETVETLARAIAPVIGYEQTAVCILEHEWATVVMVDTHDGETPDGRQAGAWWLRRADVLADRNVRPRCVAPGRGGCRRLGHDITRVLLATRKGLAGTGVRADHGAGDGGAGRRSGGGRKAPSSPMSSLVARPDEPVAAPRRPRRWSYAGAVTALAAGAVTFVAFAVAGGGYAAGPDKEPSTTKHMVAPPTPQVAEAVAPAVASPPDSSRPAHRIKGAGCRFVIPSRSRNQARPTRTAPSLT